MQNQRTNIISTQKYFETKVKFEQIEIIKDTFLITSLD